MLQCWHVLWGLGDRIDVSLLARRFGPTTLAASLQVLDRLCASHLYREAIVCEKRGPRAGSCDSVLQLAVVLQNSNHDMPAELQETGCAAEDLPPVKPRSASPTAVQRLAALHTGAAGSVTPGQLHHKKHLHRKKRVRGARRCFV